ELRPELGRHVVDGEEADVLERVQRGRLARPADAREDHEVRAHEPAPASQRQATMTSPRSTIATPPTCATRCPGQSTTSSPPSSSTANATPPTLRCTTSPVAAAGLRPGGGSPCCTMRQRSPSCTTVAGTP